MKLYINQLQTFSLHDGPGVRSTVFLQGCNLRCVWCHNPETWSKNMGIIYTKSKCINCGVCVGVCPNSAHKFINGKHEYIRERCRNCRACLKVCHAQAMEANGIYIELKDLLTKLLRDKNLYEHSGGGVTISGGEPLLQYEAVSILLRKLKEHHIHTAIETALNIPYEWIEKCIPWLDLIIVDFKLFDSNQHMMYTGTDNLLIKSNLKNVAKTTPLCVRIPVVKDINDNMANMKKTAKFLNKLNANGIWVELLSYHDLGIPKAEKIGIIQKRFSPPTTEFLNTCLQLFGEYGLKTKIN